jgi:hypothetical protein
MQVTSLLTPPKQTPSPSKSWWESKHKPDYIDVTEIKPNPILAWFKAKWKRTVAIVITRLARCWKREVVHIDDNLNGEIQDRFNHFFQPTSTLNVIGSPSDYDSAVESYNKKLPGTSSDGLYRRPAGENDNG